MPHWTRHDGNQLPHLPNDTHIAVCVRSGEFQTGLVSDFNWYHKFDGDDIMAYFVIAPIEPKPTKPESPNMHIIFDDLGNTHQVKTTEDIKEVIYNYDLNIFSAYIINTNTGEKIKLLDADRITNWMHISESR